MKKNIFLIWAIFTFILYFLLSIHPFNKTLLANNDDDKNKFVVCVLFDQHAVAGVGHLAILIGNKYMGFSYFSKSNESSNNIKGEYFESQEVFYNKVSRYQKFYEIGISKLQCDKMISVSKNIIDNYYHMTQNSCVDFVQFVLTAGHLNAGSHDIKWPQECFDFILANNTGYEDVVASFSTSAKTSNHDEIDLSGNWKATSIDSNGMKYEGELEITQTCEFITAISTTNGSIWNGSFDRQKKIINATYINKFNIRGKITLWLSEDRNTLQGTWSAANVAGYGTYIAKR